MGADDDPADRLYGLPLEEFVPARDALAKALRAGGDRARAEEVRRLAKPTRAAWAVNVAVREHPDAASALVEAARALQGAQQEALAGGDGAALREAAEHARRAIDALVEAAPATGAAADRVRATLHAATVDPEVRDEVGAGRVVRDRAASGFGGLELAPDAPAGRARAAAAPASPRPARDERRRRDQLRRAKEAEAAAEHDLAAARRALEQVEAALAERRRQVREAQARVDDARRRRRRAEG